ncbi:hypothetical protein BU24DRAFT_445943 [Aaosphaeria arxii CBS 175.79]|uniref:Telomere-associated protein Rif1 N-terminal domain-containing protein n=1 Tax=Aaosphaeria arxii CBS 175.79 TaxID=1450172 RepID=A0A6A5Y5K8_9PLEO|nr:uncharacterized protein BU24DRAFT_445943 [Aaosphaeria arxii CBS 175.79]KAF2020788.1 hypothetical protein BU24DRAFT_445943 [Aaosphaeria arxii CBS 175.79]
MVFSKFESLSVRPPTPPKDINEAINLDQDIQETLEFLNDPFASSKPSTKDLLSKPILSTPEQSPSSDIDDPSSTGSRTKKVNFEIPSCNAPSSSLKAHPWTPLRSSPLRPLPQTRVTRPLKSILKPSDQISTPPPIHDSTAAHKHQSLAEMLESIVKSLAQGSRASKLDAYITLLKTMAAYDKIPDIQAMIDKMPLLCDYIERDMQAVGISGSGSDSQLIGQAIKLLMALVRIPELRTAMTDDFGSRVVDRIIKVAEDANMPKAIINVHLALLMQQNFRPKTMTITRTERILDILDSIHDRVTGYSVQAYRIRIYRKIIQQRPEVMIKHTERWLKHVIKAMLANQKDIHQSALDMAITAVRTIGHERTVTKSVLAIMNRIKSDGNTFGALLAQQLETMLNTESAALVPQIWGVLTAFLRDSLQENSFAAIGKWLKVLEKFFCSENESVKAHSNVAANFLVYAVNITHTTTVIWSKMFFNISQHRLKQPGQSRKSETDTATSGYLTLLYYALRPTASHAQLDRYWTEYVADFWRPLIQSSPKHAIAACRLVSALFNGSRKPWNEQRALELKPQLLIQREELPLLDPKWVRKSLSTILEFIQILLDATPWQADVGGDEPVKTMWISLLNSLVEAGSKEIMATAETRDAVAHIVNMLRRMWDKHTAELALPQQKENSWAGKFCFLLETVVEKLGAMQFSDKCLTRNGHDEFEVASTPSHRSRQNGQRISPLLYFVDLLVSRSEGRLSDAVRLRIIQIALDPCYHAQNTRFGKLELLRDCSASAGTTSKNAVTSTFWGQIASMTRACIQEHPSDSNERQSRQLGKEYEMVVEILALGHAHLFDAQLGRELLSTFVETVRREAGDGAVVLAVVEKVSENVLLKISPEDRRSCLPYASILLNNLPKNTIRRVLDQGRQNLYPSSPAPTRSQEFDPYNHFYTAINSIISAAYQNLDLKDTETTKEFITALMTSIQQSPSFLIAVYLRKIQQTLKLWIEDPERKLQSKKQSAKVLHNEILKLWQTVCDTIKKLPRKDSSILVTLEPLISAGFLSRRRSIVNISIETWNDTFGKEENLRYPSRLEGALRRLHRTVDLVLPSLDVDKTDEGSQASFYESEDEEATTPHLPSKAHIKDSAHRVRKSGRKSRSKSKSRSPAVPPSDEHKSRRTPKVRLRHENSQITFEPIVSSPSNPFQQESQLLTDRQKEMIARQRATGNLFSDIGVVPSSQSEVQTSSQPSEGLFSDALTSEDLPEDGFRTPVAALAAMGPMDAYLGSSPTPHARNRHSQVRSDTTSVATPTASRTMHVADSLAELGSSPPQFERDNGVNSYASNNDDVATELATDSFEQAQKKKPSSSFEEGTTIEDDVDLPANAMEAQAELVDDAPPESTFEDDNIEIASSTSSTMELQLNAQLNEEIKAHTSFSTRGSAPEDTQEDPSLYADARSQKQIPGKGKRTRKNKGTNASSQDQSSMSVIENLSTETRDKRSTPKHNSQVQTIRRSSRHSNTPSPSKTPNSKKRKQSPMETTPARNKSRRTRKQESAMKAKVETEVMDDIEEFEDDCITVASPDPAELAPRRTSQRTSKSPATKSPATKSPAVKSPAVKSPAVKSPAVKSPAIKSQITIPETSRKRSLRRSASTLSQVESVNDDEILDDTPVAKRTRTSKDQDASGARSTSRLSHVQVTPRISQSSPSSVPETEISKDNSSIPSQQRDQTPPAKTEHLDVAASQPSQAESATPSQSFTSRVISTPRSIMARVRKMIVDCKDLVLGREEEREMDDLLFDLRTHVHAAGARGRVD